MKPLFNDHSLRIFNRFALPVVIAMSLSTALLPFLPTTSREHPQVSVTPFYDLYRLGALFGLRVDEKGVEMKKVLREVLTPIPHRLTAIYSDGTNAFVAINDGSSTTFVDYGTMYKNLYRLVSISQTSAVFLAYGKRMTLQLGEDGNLSIKETVSTFVPIQNSSGAPSSYTLSRAMIDRYNENLGETWKNFSLKEVTAQGKTTGFRVEKIAEATPFALLGLQMGDIITSIDNKPLNSYAAAFAAYQIALRQSAIKITILRNNQPKDLEYEISR